jgi:DUF1680 family protein
MWLTRDLMRWTGDARYGDYYERNLYNGILSAQNPEDGMFCYFTPMKAGLSKTFGRPLDSFWCCYGTGVQAYADLTGGIYFHDANGIYVNLFIPSEVAWRSGGESVLLVQSTLYPEVGATELKLKLASPSRFSLRVRVPWWVRNGYEVKVNGARTDVTARPGAFLALDRTWQNGDTVEIRMPMSIYTEPMNDDPGLVAFMFGPMTLAGLVFDDVQFRGDKHDPSSWIEQAPDSERIGTARMPRPTNFLPEYIDYPRQPALTFRTKPPNVPVKFIPLYSVVSSPYGIYFRVND